MVSALMPPPPRAVFRTVFALPERTAVDGAAAGQSGGGGHPPAFLVMVLPVVKPFPKRDVLRLEGSGPINAFD